MYSINKTIIGVLLLVTPLFSIAQNDTEGENDPSSYVKEPQKTEFFEVKTSKISLPEDVNELIKSKVKEYSAYSLNLDELVKYSNESPYHVAFNINIEEDVYNVDLIRNELRSKNYIATEILAKSEEKSKKRDKESEDFFNLTTFKGIVNFQRENYARFALRENLISGYIYLEKEHQWLYIQSLNEFLKLAGKESNDIYKNQILVYKVSSIKESLESCNATASKTDTTKEEDGSRGNDCVERVIEYATEADFEFFQAHGSNANQANQQIIDWLNLVEGVYSANFNVRFSVTQQFVFTQNNDPYTDANIDVYGNQLRTFWNNNRVGVDRDIALVFTGQSIFAQTATGAAELNGSIFEPDNDPNNNNGGFGSPCVRPEWSYQVTRTRAGAFLTLAHEIGHLFMGLHQDGCNCTSNNQHSCGYTGYSSIMCQGEKELYFNEWERASILGHIKANNNCFEDAINISPSNLWLKTWTNDHNEHWIGGWYQQDGDQKTTGDFDGDGDEELMFFSKAYGTPKRAWYMMLEHSCDVGADWITKMHNNGNRYFNNWYQNTGDRHIAGDFNGDGRDEVLSLSNSEKWAMVQTWNPSSNSWNKLWDNGGSHWVAGWYFKKSDQLHIGDFDGDGRDELLCIASNGWSKLLNFDNNTFSDYWSNGGSGQIEATPANTSYTYRSGYFLQTNKKDLLNIYGHWYTILSFNPSTAKWDWKFSNMGTTNNISGWYIPLGGSDKVQTGNVDDTDLGDELMFFNSNPSNHDWAASMSWNGNGFTQNWNNGGTGSLQDWNLESTDWLPVRADNVYPKQLLGFRRETNGKYYPGAMYRARNATQNFKTENSIEQLMMGSREYKLLVYPNPTTGTINFISAETPFEKATVSVFDITGRLVSKSVFNGYANSIQLSEQPKGMYTVQINQTGTITNYKIILE